MKWENLKSHKCPYCSEATILEGGIIRCTQCRFEITKEKAKSITEHRTHPERSAEKRFRWQNLHDQCCPECGDMLKPGEGQYELLKCIQAGCRFIIREDMMQRILADEEHPANRFYKPL